MSSSLKLVLSKQNFISIGFRYDPVLQNCILNLLKLYFLIQNSKLILNSVKSISQKKKYIYYTKMWLLYLLTNLMGSSTSVITTSSSNLEVSMFNFFKALTFSSWSASQFLVPSMTGTTSWLKITSQIPRALKSCFLKTTFSGVLLTR